MVPDKVPMAKHPRWAVVGRSNVGKSSLLNTLTHPRKLFRTGSKPGVTIGLIAVTVQVAKPKEAVLELVDLPGWGFAKRTADEKKFWGPLSDALNEKSPKGLLWVMLGDPMRVPLDEEFEFMDWIGHQPFVFVFTKSDRIHENSRAEIEEKWQPVIDRASEGPIWVSSQNQEGLKALMTSARDFTRLHTT